MSPSSPTTARPGSSQLPVTVVPTPPRVRGYRPPIHLADLDPNERRRLVVDAGYPSFRADQISRHYFAHGGETPEGWSDVPVRQREPLSELILPALLDPVHTVSADGGLTQKFLWRLTDGSLVETVLMRYPSSMGSVRRAGTRGRKGDPRPRVTVCVSSQSGCGMGCPFCATGQGGLARSLSTAEIVDQVVRVAHALGQGPLAAGSAGVAGAGPGAGERITNVVFMGMGEPLANYTAVVRAVRRLTAPVPAGFGLSARNLTVSTVGLIPAMQRLAGEQLPVTLALSLHAPDDPLRDELVPVNRRWPVRESLDAAYDYFRATGRRVSIEYALIRDVNDQSWRADLLGSLLSSRAQGWAHVNLIPLNPTPGSRWTASRPEVATEFQRRLQQAGVTTTVRDNRGQQAAAACGQLAGRWPAPGEHGQAPVSVC